MFKTACLREGSLQALFSTVQVAVRVTRWGRDPLTRGSYSYCSPACDLSNLGPGDLARPLLDTAGAPRLLFCGEVRPGTEDTVARNIAWPKHIASSQSNMTQPNWIFSCSLSSSHYVHRPWSIMFPTEDCVFCQ